MTAASPCTASPPTATARSSRSRSPTSTATATPTSPPGTRGHALVKVYSGADLHLMKAFLAGGTTGDHRIALSRAIIAIAVGPDRQGLRHRDARRQGGVLPVRRRGDRGGGDSLTAPLRAIRIDQWGGPDVLKLVEDAPMPEPGEGETLIRVSLAGVNYADTHARENAYLARFELPLIPGSEVAGTTEDGTRVAAIVAHGGYAEYAVAPVPIPDPRRRVRHRGARAADPGPDRVAPVQDLRARPARARPSSCTPRPAASARSPSSSARRSARA